MSEQELRSLAGALESAYKNANDDRMKEMLDRLSECRDVRPLAAAYLYQAIEYRPWDGPYYEPKSWRGDVTQALNDLYQSEELLAALKLQGDAVSGVLHEELAEIFKEPLYVMNPVLDLKIEADKYTHYVTPLIELLMEIALCWISENPPGTEKKLEFIEALDLKIRELAEELKDDRTYGSFQGVPGNADRIREALNNS